MISGWLLWTCQWTFRFHKPERLRECWHLKKDSAAWSWLFLIVEAHETSSRKIRNFDVPWHEVFAGLLERLCVIGLKAVYLPPLEWHSWPCAKNGTCWHSSVMRNGLTCLCQLQLLQFLQTKLSVCVTWSDVKRDIIAVSRGATDARYRWRVTSLEAC